MLKPEILAPAGDKEKAEIAIAFGADALYLAGKKYGMRASAGNFSDNELIDIIKLAHANNVKVYVTVNIFAQNKHLIGLVDYLKFLESISVDAIIVADPGVFRLAKKNVPNLPLHISTQGNVSNIEAVRFWKEQGAERIILARELNKADIAAIASAKELEVEVFVHGSLCMAYSGRCMLSKVLIGRDANLGACTQSCRWSYALMEAKRPGEYFPVEEDQAGTYIFNSLDLCLIKRIPELMAMGVCSFKIEGRMKSIHYTATVTRAYRLAVDYILNNKWNTEIQQELEIELGKVSHRPYYEGFYADEKPGTFPCSAENIQEWEFVGLMQSPPDPQKGAVIDVRNRIQKGDMLEIFSCQQSVFQHRVVEMICFESGLPIEEAHPNMKIYLPLKNLKSVAILRRKKD